MHRIILAVFLTSSIAMSVVFSQGHPLDVAASKMDTLPDFTVSLIAGEPIVRQPVAIDFDERGRLWCMQYLQYPNPAELKRVKVDRFSRTIYDRVPEPPPFGPKGADRLTILEKGKPLDFVNKLNIASGFAFGHGGVFVLQVPYLLFYPDRNRNDVPDGDPIVCLSGFGMDDAHSVANSLTFGPDGWLYGCQGSTVTANIRGVEFQQGVWRYHPLTHRFELFCEGGGNSWGLDFDAVGNLFYSTNVGGFAMLQGVQGGYYWKSFGKHGELHNRFAYGYFDHTPHLNFKGGHVTVGGVVYQGDSFPSKFRGSVIAADLLGHGVYWHTLDQLGSTFTSTHGGELLMANDLSFAPSDVCVGPDGAVYVADFHDARTAHPDPDAEWDRTNGRIYRIQSKDAKPLAPFDLGKLSSRELVTMLDHPNEWHARTARRILADRRDPEMILPLRTRIREAKSEAIALHALWGLIASGGFDESFGVELLDSPFPHVRRWGVRLLGDELQLRDETLNKLVAMGKSERHATVRSQLASTAKCIPAKHGIALVYEMLQTHRDDYDRHIPLLLWWALEAHQMKEPGLVVERFAKSEAWDIPLQRGVILQRVIRRFAADGSKAGFDACRQFVLNNTPQRVGFVFGAIDAGWSEQQKPIAPPDDFVKVIIDHWQRHRDDRVLLRMAMRTKNRDAFAHVQSLFGKHEYAIQAWGELGDESGVPLLLKQLDDGSANLKPAIITALQRFDVPAIGEAFVKLVPTSPTITNAMASRRAWAKLLLESIDRGEFPAKDISIDVLRIIASHNDAHLNELVKKHWGTITTGTPEEKLAEVRRFSNDLRAGAGDSGRGKALFTKQCATCHQLHGEGQKIGPDLTHANRKDSAYLLQQIVDPNVIIRKEYATFIVESKDGRVLTGNMIESNDESFTIVDAKNQRTRILRREVESMRESTVSMMPENLLKDLKPQELRDLFAYLMK